ncbi:hypothetical protein B0O99DRAFT_626631 [Bisporella sp. PMI_857]|nr:hypothetical protein B0O99DRAFT_626631 [Bisporella sp. PMI_857]
MLNMSDQPFTLARPATPQSMVHRLPDKPNPTSEPAGKPSKYIILLMGSTAVAGKVQIAQSVAKALSCPLFQGDSLHESTAKAASIGGAQRPSRATTEELAASSIGGPGAPNETRYQRMWLSKMTRTGLLFPEESRPAQEGFSGFGGSSATTSRRGSDSSIASASSSITGTSVASSIGSTTRAGNFMTPAQLTTQFINNPIFAVSETERLRKANPALLVLTHPELEKWHKTVIRQSVGEYGIGVIFVPLYEDGDLPVLKPLDPRAMTSFGSFDALKKSLGGSLDEETVLTVDVDANVEEVTEEIVDGVKVIMGIEE